MKKFTLSAVTILAMSGLAVAGGDIEPVVAPVVEVVETSDSGFYAGVAYSWITESHEDDSSYVSGDGLSTSTSSSENEIEQNAYMLQLGYKINQYLAVEGRYWKSTGDTDYSYSYSSSNNGVPNPPSSSSSSDSEQDRTAYGIYLKPMYPVTDALDVYGLVGYGSIKMEDSNSGANPYERTQNGMQFGAGVSYTFTNNLAVFADYVSLSRSNDEYSSSNSSGDSWSSEYTDSTYTMNFGLSYIF